VGQIADRPDRLRTLRNWVAAGVLATLAPLALVGCGQGPEADYVASWGPNIGTKAPLLAANDQDGDAQTLETLAGPSGVLLVFNRSVDW